MNGYKLIMLLMTLTISGMIFAKTTNTTVESERLMYQTSCDAQWKYDQKGRHRHVGRAVCACYADAVLQYKDAHNIDGEFKDRFFQFKNQAAQFCVTGGVYNNSIQLAVFERINDRPSIEGICNSFWVGLMRTFQPSDPRFDSKKICECASEEMTKLVQQYDSN